MLAPTIIPGLIRLIWTPFRPPSGVRVTTNLVQPREQNLKKRLVPSWWPVLLIGLGGIGNAGAGPRVLSLEEALELVLAQSKEVQLARAGVAQAAGDQLVARSQFYPQLAATAGYTRTLKSQFEGLGGGAAPDSTAQGAPPDSSANTSFFDDLPFGQKNQYSLGLSLSQNLFAGGRLVAQKRGADARYRSAALSLSMARAQALLEVTRRYYDALLAEELSLIADSSLVQAEAVLAQTEAAWKEGQKSEYELLRAQVVRDNQRPLVLQRQGEKDQAHLRLKELLNLSFDDSLRLTTAPDAPLPRFAAAADTSAGQRAPVRQAHEGVASTEALLRAARGEGLPALSLSSRYTPVAYPRKGLPGWGDFRSDWTVGVSLSLPLLTGRRLAGSEGVARSQVEAARTRLAQASQAAALEARTVQRDLAQAEASLQATATTVAQARRAYGIAELRYREGLSTQLELSDARLLLDQALANQARAACTLQVARARLSLLAELPLSGGTASPISIPASAAPAPTTSTSAGSF